MQRLYQRSERGQGLVEYALILVLVAVIVVIVLALLGPAIGNVFSNLVSTLHNPGAGVISNVSANRLGGGSSDTVQVEVTVATNTSVTITDSQGALPLINQPCNGSCTFNIVVGDDGGIVTVTAAAGGSFVACYDFRFAPGSC